MYGTPTYPADSYWQPVAHLLTEEDDVRRGIWPVSFAFWLTCFYIALFIIRPWEILIPWLAEIRFERLFVLLLIVVVALQRGFSLRADAQTIALGIHVGALGICTINAYSPTQAWNGTAGLYTYLTTVFGYFLFTSVVRTKYELTFLIACQLVATGVYLGKCVWEFFLHGAGYYAMGVLRLQGIDLTNGHPNSVATTIVISLPLCVFLWQVRDAFTSSWPPFWRTWFARGLLIFLCIALVALAATNSRGGVVVATIYGALFLRRQSSFGQQLTYLFAFVTVACVVWFVIPEESRDRIRSIWDKEASNASAQESSQGRLIGLQQGLEMFRRFPMTGVGIDNFTLYRVRCLDGVPLDAHNLLGELLAQTGMLGGVAFVLLVGTMARNARLLLRRDEPIQEGVDYYRAIGQFGWDSLILLFFQGVTTHNMSRYNWIWLAAFMAIAARLAADEPDSPDAPRLPDTVMLDQGAAVC